MTASYYNLSGTSVQSLTPISSGDQLRTIDRLLICNTDTTAVTVSLYLDNGAGTTYKLLHLTSIPVGVTLDFLNGVPITYGSKYKLDIVLGNAAYTADVICNII